MKKIEKAIHGLFFIYFRLFKQTFQFIQQINENKCPSIGIRTHDLRNMSVLPKLLDHKNYEKYFVKAKIGSE